jgi:hypothetical protein
MRKEIFLAALRMQETDGPITPLVMMDYLPGPEVSFDLLASNGRILKYVARTKLAREQVIESAFLKALWPTLPLDLRFMVSSTFSSVRRRMEAGKRLKSMPVRRVALSMPRNMAPT